MKLMSLSECVPSSKNRSSGHHQSSKLQTEKVGMRKQVRDDNVVDDKVNALPDSFENCQTLAESTRKFNSHTSSQIS